MTTASPLDPARDASSRWGLATADLSGLPPELVEDASGLIARFEDALAASGLSWSHHRFAPSGLSIVGTSAGTRVVLHTWPEHGMLTIDLYAPASEVEEALAACVRGLRSREWER